jgi:integrase
MKSCKLTTSKINQLRPKDWISQLSDGKCLWLEVRPSGVKSWRVRYRLLGRAMKTNVGRFPQVGLTEARRKRTEILEAARAGLSLAEAERRQKAKELRGATVYQFGERYMRDIVKDARKNPDAVRRMLDRDVYPALDDKLMSSVTVDDLRELIFARKDAGRKQAALALRDLLKRLWDYAVVRGVVSANPVLAIPRKYIAKASRRRRALSVLEIGEFIYRIKSSRLKRTLKCALQLILLTLVRKSELRLARWQDIDLKSGEWRIPPEHTKNREPHIVYLSTGARQILVELMNDWPDRAPKPKQHVIPSPWSRTQPIAESTLNGALKRISQGMQHFTVHDLRRTAATLLNDGGFESDVVEKALNHTLPGVKGVYNLAQYSEQRKTMLQNWADKVEDLAITWRERR